VAPWNLGDVLSAEAVLGAPTTRSGPKFCADWEYEVMRKAMRNSGASCPSRRNATDLESIGAAGWCKRPPVLKKG